MNAHQVKAHYSKLTAEERFRLILAASGRNDAAEREQLVSTGHTKSLAHSDHWPYAQAFTEIASYVFMELLEEAAIYHDLLMSRSTKKQEPENELSDADNDSVCLDRAWQKDFDLMLVTGCILHLKLKGWELFCQQLDVPDRLLWQEYPGYQRLDRLLELSRGLSFVPKGFLRWLNRNRPKGSPKHKRLPLSAKQIARSNELVYRERARWWGAKD